MLGTIAASLITAGPSLIRAAGALMGDDGKAVADQAAKAVESVAGRSNATQDVERQLQAMTPEQINALESIKIKIQQIKAETREAEINARVEQTGQINETMRSELVAKSLFKSGWRAAVGWVMALSFTLMTGALCWAIVEDPTQLPEAISGFMTMAIAMAAVLGIQINRDSGDKQAAMTGSAQTTLMGALAQRIKK